VSHLDVVRLPGYQRRALASLASLEKGWYLRSSLAGMLTAAVRLDDLEAAVQLLRWASTGGAPLGRRLKGGRSFVFVDPDLLRVAWPELFHQEAPELVLGPVDLGEVDL